MFRIVTVSLLNVSIYEGVFEKRLGPQYVVEIENKSSFTNQMTRAC